MKAGESPWNQGRSNGRPVRLQKAVPRDEGKTPQWGAKGAPVRVMGRQFPSAGWDRSDRKMGQRCGVPRPRISALRFPHYGSAKGSNDNLARQPAGMRRAATLRSVNIGTEKIKMPKFAAPHSPPSCPRLSRASTPCLQLRKAWMAGTSPAMTNFDSMHVSEIASLRSQ